LPSPRKLLTRKFFEESQVTDVWRDAAGLFRAKSLVGGWRG